MNAKKISNKAKARQTELVDDQGEQDDAVIGRAFMGSMIVVGLVVAAGVSYWLINYFSKAKVVEKNIEVTLPQQREVVPVKIPAIPLKDVTSESGIDFVHFNAMGGEKLLPETMGGGGAFFDYDRDGDQDLLLLNSSPWPWSTKAPETVPTMKLYANDGKGKFSDVTATVGLALPMFGMGPALGDFDGDGWTDLFVANVGKNRLFHNEQGKFVDVTDQAGVAGSEDAWSTGCCFLDYDNDGRLDLFVCNYVQWSRQIDLDQEFNLDGIGRAYGPPAFFKGTNAHLYHNDGNGKFSDVSEKAGIQVANPATKVPMAKGLGIGCTDVDRDGWIDLVIANDTVANFLFLNQKDGTFREQAVPASIAFDRSGSATGAMGVDCGYIRNNETLAILVGNFANEPCSLYISRGSEASFFDAATATGIGPLTRMSLTFGTLFADLDLDSRLDIICCNGHLEADIGKVANTQRYAQPPQFFWNAGPGGGTEFLMMKEPEITKDAIEPMVGRGATYADIDNDGDLDVLLIANGGKPRLLRNDQATGNHWLRVRLQGKGNQEAIGAELKLYMKEGDKSMVQTRCVMPTRSYLSQVELPITFGLGASPTIEKLDIRWPDGKTQTVTDLKIDQMIVIEQQ